jgi:predicted SAM-dependent methyltransferase
MLRWLSNRLLHTWFGYAVVRFLVAVTQYRVFMGRTVHLMELDVMRLRARLTGQKREVPQQKRLHFGCGARSVKDWLNVDLASGDRRVDLLSGQLPWVNNAFTAIVGQHVIEHFDLLDECLPFFRELYRVSATGAEVWLSCPDLEKVCQSYFIDKGASMIADRLTRPHKDLGMSDVPTQHFINAMFHQSGEHKNLLDFELLNWALTQAGFSDCVRVQEQDLLDRFPSFPKRNDDYCTLYVRAMAAKPVDYCLIL